MPRQIPFNINHRVGIKLTEQGIKVYKQYHDELFKNSGYDPRIYDKYVEPDENGCVWMPLWEVMQYFGSECSMGRQLNFETTIFLKLDQN